MLHSDGNEIVFFDTQANSQVTTSSRSLECTLERVPNYCLDTFAVLGKQVELLTLHVEVQRFWNGRNPVAQVRRGRRGTPLHFLPSGYMSNDRRQKIINTPRIAIKETCRLFSSTTSPDIGPRTVFEFGLLTST